MEQTHRLFRVISTEDLAKLAYASLESFEAVEMGMLLKYNVLEVPG